MAKRLNRDLSLDEIVRTAGEIARTQGERDLTMRRVAEACGVTPMALYHHVTDKETLLTLIVDDVVGAAIGDFGRSDLAWDEDLIEFACRFRREFVANQTAAEVFLRRPVLSENMARCTVLMFDSIERGGFEGSAVAHLTDAVVLTIMGSIANDLSRPPDVRRDLSNHAAPREASRMTAHLDDYSDRDGEERLRNALRWLLHGASAG